MSKSAEIRKAKLSDFSEIHRLMVLLGYKISKSEIQNQKIEFEVIIESKHQNIFVIEGNDSNTIDAMISYSVLPQLRFAGLKMEVDELIVNPEKRSMGLGSKLVQFALEQAKMLRVKKVIISNNRERESYHRKFYQKLGFCEKNSAFFEFTIV